MFLRKMFFSLVLLLPICAMGQTVYTNQANFDSAVLASGFVLSGFEDFEHHVLDLSQEDVCSGTGFSSSLEPGVPATSTGADLIFPNGLENQDIQLNAVDGSNDGAQLGIYACNLGGMLNAEIDVSFDDAIQVELLNPSLTALSFNIVDAFGGGNQRALEILDSNGVPTYSNTVTATEDFIGVIFDPSSSVGIVNIGNSGLPYLDNISTWKVVPEPSTFALSSMILLLALNRLRRHHGIFSAV